MNPREPDIHRTGLDPDKMHETGDAQPTGDLGGPYGYGRPAHRPDPSGHYRFEPRTVRPLPANPKIRWR
ncbi:MAG TPA: hypothetical protein VHC00_17370 [Rhizobiaceae bacterium]|nr:hypothetical protein [Rhizobiaceae bacterium]